MECCENMQHNVYYRTLAEEENVVLRQAEKSFLGEIGHNLLMGQRAGHDVERDRNLPHHKEDGLATRCPTVSKREPWMPRRLFLLQ